MTDQVAQAFHALFRSTDPFDDAVLPTVEWRALGYPFELGLEEEQVEALRSACASTGDTRIGIMNLVDPAESWIAELAELNVYSYKNLTGMEGAIVSLSGTWGIILTFESNAVLACKERRTFDAFRASFPEFSDESVIELLQDWKREADRSPDPRQALETVIRLLDHVYGARTPQFLRDSGWVGDTWAWRGLVELPSTDVLAIRSLPDDRPASRS